MAHPARTSSKPSVALDWRVGVVLVAVAACLTPWVSPPIALTIGFVLALTGLTVSPRVTSKYAKTLIQVGVVLLGFNMDLHEVARAGKVGVVFAAGTIIGTFALGWLMGKLLKTEAKLTTLLSSGTAICGGSAIVAVGSVIAATEAQIAVAIGTVFLLNAVGLYIFPVLGHMLEMTQHQFGTWAAVAIHDVSSVVGAAAAYDQFAEFKSGPTPTLAMQTATAVKLSRALWIAPVAIAAGWWFSREASAQPGQKRKGKIPVPWFVLWFVCAAAAGTYVPAMRDTLIGGQPLTWWGAAAAKKLMAVALLLIGCGLSLKAIAAVGWRAITLGVVLWVAISVAAGVVVMKTIV